MKLTFNVIGLREVSEGLAELSRSVSTRVMREALTAGGEVLAKEMRANAPVDTGGLREGINVSSKLTTRQARSRTKQAEVEVFVGPSGGAKSVVQEFGSVEQEPQPYIRPAWDKKQRQFLQVAADHVMVSTEKALGRKAARAARVAKGK